jgi:hypothetical protein
MKGSVSFEKTLRASVEEIEGKIVVSEVVRDIVNDIEMWDAETTVFQLQEKLRKQQSWWQCQRQRTLELERANEQLKFWWEERRRLATTARAALLENLKPLLSGNAEAVGSQVALVELSRQFKSQTKNLHESDRQIKELQNQLASGHTADRDFNGTMKANHVPSGEKASVAVPAAGTANSESSSSDSRRSPSRSTLELLLTINDASLLEVFSFLDAIDVLAVTQSCRAIFKRVDSLFGVNSPIVKEEWGELTAATVAATSSGSTTSAPVGDDLLAAGSTLSAMIPQLSTAELKAIVALQNKVTELHTKVQAQTAELSSATTLVEELQESNAAHRREVDAAHAKAMEDSAAAEAAAAAADENAQLLVLLDSRVSALEVESSELRQKSQQLQATLELERESHASALTSANTESNLVKAERNTLESTFRTQKKVLVREVRQLRSSLDSSSRSLLEARAQLVTLRSAYAQVFGSSVASTSEGST